MLKIKSKFQPRNDLKSLGGGSNSGGSCGGGCGQGCGQGSRISLPKSKS